MQLLMKILADKAIVISIELFEKRVVERLQAEIHGPSQIPERLVQQ
jgi:hypothetical protein